MKHHITVLNIQHTYTHKCKQNACNMNTSHNSSKAVERRIYHTSHITHHTSHTHIHTYTHTHIHTYTHTHIHTYTHHTYTHHTSHITHHTSKHLLLDHTPREPYAPMHWKSFWVFRAVWWVLFAVVVLHCRGSLTACVYVCVCVMCVCVMIVYMWYLIVWCVYVCDVWCVMCDVYYY